MFYKHLSLLILLMPDDSAKYWMTKQSHFINKTKLIQEKKKKDKFNKKRFLFFSHSNFLSFKLNF